MDKVVAEMVELEALDIKLEQPILVEAEVLVLTMEVAHKLFQQMVALEL